MKGKAVSEIIVTLLLMGMLVFVFNIQSVKSDYAWTETIYIRADGSVYPDTAPISSFENITYTLTDNIVGDVGENSAIFVQRNNIVVDGAGYTVQGTGNGTGIDLIDKNNVTLKNAEVINFNMGIKLYSSSNNTIASNNASNNNHGIYLLDSSNNILTGNTASNNNYYGINLKFSSDDNTLSCNSVSSNNYRGIRLYFSSNNVLFGNNASNNNGGIGIYSDSDNNVLFGNNASNNEDGIFLGFSSNNTLFGNTASNNSIDGISLHDSSNNVLTGNSVSSNNYYGIRLYSSRNNVLFGNNASNNEDGIWLSRSRNNTLTGNNASNNLYGIYHWDSQNNTLTGNNVSNNNHGVYLWDSSNNTIFHNNFINNIQINNLNSTNTWDDGVQGNYWSNYAGKDRNGDGIGDTPYAIDENNQDNYPLTSPWSPTWSPKPPIEEEKVPFWMQWWFGAIIAIVIIALVGMVYLLRKGKPPLQTVPPLPSESIT